MGVFLDPEDLAPFADIADAKAEAMITDAEAQAMLVAPCLADLTSGEAKFAAVTAILRQAVLRWDESGAGGVTTTQQGAGPFQQMTVRSSQPRRGAFWPSEIEQLQRICAGEAGPKAFQVDTMPVGAGASGTDRTWITPTDWI